MLVNADLCISRQSENGENCVTGNGVIGEIPISPQSGGALKSEVDGSQRVRLGGCFENGVEKKRFSILARYFFVINLIGVNVFLFIKFE